MNNISRSVLSGTSTRALWLVAAFAVPTFISNAARADEACGDTTCQKGFVCQSYEIGKCYGSTRVDPGDPVPVAGTAGGAANGTPASGSGAASGDDGSVEPTCETTTAYECVPGPCTADADCGDGMVCHTYTNQSCGGTKPTPCAPDDPECVEVPVEPPVCTTTTTQQCVARYQLPCSTASDCGPGFTCEEQQSCWCSGSSSRPSAGSGGSAGTGIDDVVPESSGTGASASVASGGAASSAGSEDIEPSDLDAPPDTTCGCAPTGTFACKLQTIACSADADCPSGLVCADNPDTACWVSSDGTSGCTTPDPAKLCQPKNYRGSDLGVSEDGTSSASGGQSSGTPTPPVDQATGDGDQNGDSGNTGNVGSGQFGRGHHRFGMHGCAVAASPGLEQSGLASLLLGVGLALGMRRRRAHK